MSRTKTAVSTPGPNRAAAGASTACPPAVGRGPAAAWIRAQMARGQHRDCSGNLPFIRAESGVEWAWLAAGERWLGAAPRFVSSPYPDDAGGSEALPAARGPESPAGCCAGGGPCRTCRPASRSVVCPTRAVLQSRPNGVVTPLRPSRAKVLRGGVYFRQSLSALPEVHNMRAKLLPPDRTCTKAPLQTECSAASASDRPRMRRPRTRSGAAGPTHSSIQPPTPAGDSWPTAVSDNNRIAGAAARDSFHATSATTSGEEGKGGELLVGPLIRGQPLFQYTLGNLAAA